MTYEGSYRPGAWAVATTPTGWLLADLPVTDERVASAWSCLRAGGDADEVLEILLQSGLAALPGFALVVVADGTTRIIVRRDAVVSLRADAEEQVIVAGTGSWTDVAFAETVDEIHLRQQAADTSDTHRGVPVGLGIAQASRVDLFLVGSTETTPSTISTPSPAATPAPEVGPDDAVEDDEAPFAEPKTEEPETGAADYSGLFGGTQDRDAFLARLALEEEHAAESAGSDGAVSGEESAPSTSSPAADEVDEPTELPSAMTLAPPSSTTAIWTGDLPTAPDEAPALQRPVDAAPAPATPSGLIDGLPWLRSGPAPGPPPADQPRTTAAMTPPPPPTPTAPLPVEASSPVPGTPPPLPAAPSPAQAPAAALSAPPPPPPAPAPGPTPAPAPAQEDPATGADADSAALTMSRAELLAAMGNHGVVGPSVLAVRCPAGHLTPPEQDRCRVCGAGVEPATPGEVARPTLGLLRSGDGESIDLDRDIVFGRSPQATASRAASQPHLVKIADPGISRNHLHVVLDGWQVLVRDLGSSNGSEIQLPGREIEKLRAGEDYLIENGTVVTLAGDVHYTFEVTP